MLDFLDENEAEGEEKLTCVDSFDFLDDLNNDPNIFRLCFSFFWSLRLPSDDNSEMIEDRLLLTKI